MRFAQTVDARGVKGGGVLLLAVVGLLFSGASRSRALPETQPAARGGRAGAFSLTDRDVVAFLGGEWVVQDLETGHLESLLATSFAGGGVRLRNLGWEGDTVFEQPRDVNFPGPVEELRRYGVTVSFLQFGRQESRAGKDGVPGFLAAYEKLCEAVAKQSPRLVLVTPPPFDGVDAADRRARNGNLALYAAAVRDLTARRGYVCVDLFTALGGADGPGEPLTEHGTPTPRGAARVALAAARQLGLKRAVDAAGGIREKPAAGADAPWASPEMEAVRQAVVAKNRLWFRYRRPTNWAFLGGDRTSVPSSREPNDLAVRFFPSEMEQYLPLIERAEGRVEESAKAVTGGK